MIRDLPPPAPVSGCTRKKEPPPTHRACEYCGAITALYTRCVSCGAPHTINATGRKLGPRRAA